jgi:hypothetical protein
MIAPTLNLRDRFRDAASFETFLESVVANRDLWHALSRRAEVAPELVERVRRVGGRWHLLVLLEDWCGDGASTVPYIARLAAQVPNVELHVLRRDENLELMDTHLTGGARAIPVVMLLDERLDERASWGSRPGVLSAWVAGPGQLLSKEERYREVRRWYARDRGRTALEEIVALIERVASEGRNETN